MCGIAGFLGGFAALTESPRLLARRMGDRLRHRGPDDGGEWIDEGCEVSLIHRRLAVLDLSPAGHQPMVSLTGRYVLAFNGEIYNHLELRDELTKNGRDHRWRGTSDTETLLAAFEHWGVRGALEKAVGMFAIAVWDVETRMLLLARDRFGEKPLYYGRAGRAVVFGSELRALRAHPRFEPRVDRGAVALFLRYGNVPAPYAIFAGVRKVMPGSLIWLRLDGTEGGEAYGSPAMLIADAAANRFDDTDQTIVDGLESVLRRAVRQQMVADVPLGALLSGGVDSSAVVALMQAESRQPVRTFSIGFSEPGYDEAGHAAAVARHLGTDHRELYVTADDALRVIPELPDIYDEPFADSSQIPTYLVSRLARREVKVALSGDAGDEVFCGYNRYVVAARWWSRLQGLPLRSRRWIGRTATAVPPALWDRAVSPLNALRGRRGVALFGDKVHKFGNAIGAESIEDLYRRLVSFWPHPEAVVRGAGEPASFLFDAAGSPHFPRLPAGYEQMMAHDLLSYLPNDVLVKIDRAAMRVALETRIPFLDHRVVEYAWRMPRHCRLRGATTKWALRQVLYRHVPADLIERPKAGFAVPIGEWLRGSLRPWAEGLLEQRRLDAEGIFETPEVRRKWIEHLSGRKNWQAALWPILIFQQWLGHSGVEFLGEGEQ